ncbi:MULTISPECIES: ABC transporter permease [Bacillaceae]|uniref:ABC transporter permease n=1 Tax=Bacillaceae TaxID=186817 RepID=UPI0009DF43EF|nr:MULTISPECIES: ABC transporter permease [Bacillaceae]MCM3362084.1 ABC transporter permease [Niallia sp. MER TA 168]
MFVEKGENQLVIGNVDDAVHTIEKKYKKEQRAIQWKKISLNKLVVTGSIMIIFILLLTLLTPFIAKYNPVAINPIDRMKAPSMEHFFGTDNLGRDVFSRVLYGARSSLTVAIFVALFSTIIGTVIGLLASYYRLMDNIMMRIMDGIMAIPEILLAIALMAALGPSKVNIIIALGIIFVPSIARTVRSNALAVKEIPFVEALKASGASSYRIIFHHILPNCMSSLLVQVTFVFAYSIIVEASLSFLGLGTPPPAPSWGSILQEGATVIDVAWWMTLFPGLAIMITVIGLNLLGDGIRDLLDPHSNE